MTSGGASDAYNARRCSLAAGLPVGTTAQNVNRLCGSGLQAIWTGAQQIQLGISRIVVAGGNESMSRQPFMDFSARQGGGRLGDRLLVDGTLSLITDPFGSYHMGETAERVAERYGIGRADQDAFALESQRRAAGAIEGGFFDEQIAAVRLLGGDLFARDEHPRPGSSLQRLAALRPAFRPDGTVTAGNSSGINDGAAAVVHRAGDHGCRTDPGGPSAPQPDGALAGGGRRHRAERGVRAQAIAVQRELGLDPERTNPNGGAIALGHPIGATGAILVVKLAT